MSHKLIVGIASIIIAKPNYKFHDSHCVHVWICMYVKNGCSSAHDTNRTYSKHNYVQVYNNQWGMHELESSVPVGCYCFN